MANYLKGSEWRKWDLHVHSPASNGYIGSWDQFERQIKDANCSVIGINDYFSVAGYKRTIERITSGVIDIGDRVLFPVVEFRMQDVLKNRHTGRSGVNINFHIIFDPLVHIDKIETFLKSLGVDGAQIAERYDAPEFLEKTARVHFGTDVLDRLRQDKELNGHFLVWLPYDEYGGIGDIDPQSDDWIKRDFIKKADFLGSSNANQIGFFLWKSPLDGDGNPKFSDEQFRQWFGCKKPCLKGSDSHEQSYPIGQLRDEKSNPVDKCCWFKADPTFEGLKRVVSEPEGRVYIGERPPKIAAVENDAAKYMTSIAVNPEAGTNSPYWFSDTIPLNPGLVAIIGRKGTGKSALVDVIALLGNSHVDPKEFSFLKDDKFRKTGAASRYSGLLTWQDGSNPKRLLSETVDIATQPERVRYLPQAYVDQLCNEVGVTEQFQREINKVVFSYLPATEQLGTSSLKELVEKQTDAINSTISMHRERLRKVVSEYGELEGKRDPAYKKLIANRLDAKKKELETTTLPIEVKKPSVEPNQPTRERIDSLKTQLAEVGKAIELAIAKITNLNNTLGRVSNVRGYLKHLQQQRNTVVNSMEADLKALGISQGDLLVFEIKTEKLDELESATRKELVSTETTLGRKELDAPLPIESTLTGLRQGEEATLRGQRRLASIQLASITQQLTREQKAYEDYLKNRAQIEDKRRKLQGTDGDQSLTTIKSLEFELQYIEKELDQAIHVKVGEVYQICDEVFDTIAMKTSVLESIYRPLSEFVEQEQAFQRRAQSVLTFDVAIVCDKDRFAQRFLSLIDHGRDGSFQGRAQGRDRLIRLLQASSFGTKESVRRFLNELLKVLRIDQTAKPEKKMEISKQLVPSTTKPEFLTWLFGLDYIDVQYRVKFNGKDLNAAEFSPGERGAILLIFYLLIDRDNIPLIIDQPEENLDNESVFQLLVPYVKRAKENRQVVIVTHNPNLAVVCDAEQIISTEMDKSTNEIRYKSGSIEEPATNLRIIDVLEGTMPAFRTRDGAYQNRNQ